MGRIIEGYWDCSYCDTVGIGGLTQSCPNCGRTRSEDTKFYLKEKDRFVNPDKVEKGPDWYCEACDSYNPSSATLCKQCGTPRDSESKNYFEKRAEMNAQSSRANYYNASHSEFFDDTINENKKQQNPSKDKTNILSILKYVGIIALIGIIITGIVFAIIPKERTISISDTSWSRSIEVEVNKLVEESDWSVPEKAVEVIDSRREVHHYDKVLDHYETVTEQKSREVFDGYDTYSSYVDNGNGTFEEVTHQTPRYRTEYYTETRQEPVYRDEPVYKTKYYYTIWRWVHSRDVTESGKSDPYWPEVEYGKKEREGKKTEKYTVKAFYKDKEKTYNCDYEIWSKLKVDHEYKVKISGKDITEILE